MKNKIINKYVVFNTISIVAFSMVLPTLKYNTIEKAIFHSSNNEKTLKNKALNNTPLNNSSITKTPKESSTNNDYFKDKLNNENFTAPATDIYKEKTWLNKTLKETDSICFSGSQNVEKGRYSNSLNNDYNQNTRINLEGHSLGNFEFNTHHGWNSGTRSSKSGTYFNDVRINLANIFDSSQIYLNPTEENQYGYVDGFNVGDIKRRFASKIAQAKREVLRKYPNATIKNANLYLNKIYFNSIYLKVRNGWSFDYAIEDINSPTFQVSIEINYENYSSLKNTKNDFNKPISINVKNLKKIVLPEESKNNINDSKLNIIATDIFAQIKRKNTGKGIIYDLNLGSSFNIVKENNDVKINYHLKIINSNYRDYLDVSINPFIYVANDNMIKPSCLSNPVWLHTDDGRIKYHLKAPKTKILMSEKYLEALRIEINKEKTLNLLNTDNNWYWKDNDKSLAKELINSGSLNCLNYEDIKTKYNKNGSSIFKNLVLDKRIESIIVKNNWNKIAWNKETINLYLYALKNATFNFNVKWTAINWASSTIHKSLNFINFNENASFSLNNTQERNIPNKISCNIESSISYDKKYSNISKKELSFDIPDLEQYKNLYDLDFNTSNLEKIIIHTYYYQTTPTNIFKDISFSFADGTMLDQNFKILVAGSSGKYKIGEFGFSGVRYNATLLNGSNDLVYLVLKDGKWYSEKYHSNIKVLDNSFEVKKLEYVFNQDLHMYINPYVLNGQKLKPGVITSKTQQKYGIKKVVDYVNGSRRVLEDWTDGKWSHTQTKEGLAKFDGIFGADISGFDDPNGRLSEGTHQISVELMHKNIKNMNLNYKIVVDSKIQSPDIDGKTKKVDGTYIHYVENGVKKIAPLYLCNGPINFRIRDIDIKSVQALLLDSSGKWWKLPITILNKKIGNKWVRYINSTMNYAGFAKISFLDNVGNKKTIFFETVSNPDLLTPNIGIDKSIELFPDKEILFKGKRVRVINYSKKVNNGLFLADPLITNFNIEKVELKKDGTSITHSAQKGVDFNTTPKKGSIKDPKKYRFGKTLGGSGTPLRFIVDELAPMFDPSTDKSLEKAWSMSNSNINFLKPGLYKIKMNTCIDSKKEIIHYIQVIDPKHSKLNNNFNFNVSSHINILKNGSSTLPVSFNENYSSKTTEKINIDKNLDNVATKFSILMPNYLIENLDIKFSSIWYNDFYSIDLNSVDNLHFNDEGKYIVNLTDIFGNKYYKEILIINPDKSDRGDWNHLADPKYEKNDTDLLKHSFFAGKMKWSYGRYEDEDHILWESKTFIKKEKKKGIGTKEAEKKYKEIKSHPFWGTKPKFKIFQGGHWEVKGGVKVWVSGQHWEQGQIGKHKILVKGHWEVKGRVKIWIPTHWEVKAGGIVQKWIHPHWERTIGKIGTSKKWIKGHWEIIKGGVEVWKPSGDKILNPKHWGDGKIPKPTTWTPGHWVTKGGIKVWKPGHWVTKGGIKVWKPDWGIHWPTILKKGVGIGGLKPTTHQKESDKSNSNILTWLIPVVILGIIPIGIMVGIAYKRKNKEKLNNY